MTCQQPLQANPLLAGYPGADEACIPPTDQLSMHAPSFSCCGKECAHTNFTKRRTNRLGIAPDNYPSFSKRRVLSQLIVNPFHHPLLNGAADSVHSLSQRLLESWHSISVKNLQYRFLDNFLKGGQ